MNSIPSASGWEQLCSEVYHFNKRVTQIDRKAYQQAVRRLQKLYPKLPTQSCLHLAHNWLVCGDDKELAMKAKAILNKYYAIGEKVANIKDQWYSRRYNELIVSTTPVNPSEVSSNA